MEVATGRPTNARQSGLCVDEMDISDALSIYEASGAIGPDQVRYR